eukprot:1600706-Pyramimonas_sp.AAC.1
MRLDEMKVNNKRVFCTAERRDAEHVSDGHKQNTDGTGKDWAIKLTLPVESRGQASPLWLDGLPCASRTGNLEARLQASARGGSAERTLQT